MTSSSSDSLPLRFFEFLDRWGLFTLSIFLLAFIPLFPKLPLFDAIPGYLVRVRVEDFLVFLTGLLWLVQIVRGKVKWNTAFFWAIGLYVIAGLLSLVAAIGLVTSIPTQLLHIGKSGLHFFRYIEYFTLFFFTFGGITSKKQLRVALGVLAGVVAVVTLYGYGQLNWRWPLYSTMNREFSKGQTLYLTEFARVQSTFAGHYDLSAFLVLVLPLLLALTIHSRRRGIQLVLGVIQLGGLWLLTASASKTGLLAYVVGVVTVVLLSLRQKPKLWRWSLIGGGAVLTVIGLCTILAVTAFRSTTITTLNRLGSVSRVQQSQTLTELNNFALGVIDPQTKLDTGRPTDVYVDVPDYVQVATVSATGEKSVIIEERERTWSDNAIRYGLSMGIRLDTLWPQAINGFITNPYTGKGYGTLNKLAYKEFTEADSTDNNYLRTIGETGVLGFITFYGVVVLVIATVARSLDSDDPLVSAVSIGFIAGSAGMLTNAFIIDVFAASKVAFMYWALAGMAVKTFWIDQPAAAQDLDLNRKRRWWQFLRRHAIFLGALALFVLLVHKQPFTEHSPVQSLSVFPNQVASVKMARCLADDWNWSACDAQLIADHSYSPLYVGLLVPWYMITQQLGAFYFSNLLLSLLSFWLLYRLARNFFPHNGLAQVTVLLVYILIPWVYQFPTAAISTNLTLTVFLLFVTVISSRDLLMRKAYLSSLLLVLTFYSIASIDRSLWLLAAPVIALIAGLLVTALTRIYLQYQDRFQPSLLATGGLIILITLGVMTGFLSDLSNYILANFRDRHPAWQYVTVQRANRYLGTRAAQLKLGETAPEKLHLVAALHPDYVSMLSNQTYSLLPLAFNTSTPPTQSNLETYQPYLAADNELYLSNIHNDHPAVAANFDAFRSQLQLQMVEIECQHQCDIYRVYPERLPFSQQPVSILKYITLRPEYAGDHLGQNDTLATAGPLPEPVDQITQTDRLRLLVFSHQFYPQQEQTVPQAVPYEPSIFHARLRQMLALFNQQPATKTDQAEAGQLAFLMGDVLQHNERSYRNLFRQLLSSVEYPVIYAPGNYDQIADKPYGPGYQAFQLGSNYFLIIDPSLEGKLDRHQELFVRNELLKLEKHPEIQHVFVFAHRPSWLLAESQWTEIDRFLNQFVYPELEKLNQLSVNVFSGAVEPTGTDSYLIQHQEQSNITFSAVNTTPTSAQTYLEVSITPDEVEINPVVIQ